jgi:hypothetical protein
VNGRKPVIFDRAVKPEWIDFALDLFLSGLGEAEMRKELESMLRANGLDFTTVQKTARQLNRFVGHKTCLGHDRLERDRQRLARLAPEDRNAIRLQLIIDASAFFADCVKALRAFAANGASSITVAQLYERVQAIYGHRGTIPRRVRNVLQTLSAFDCLHNQRGTWWVVEKSWLAELTAKNSN